MPNFILTINHCGWLVEMSEESKERINCMNMMFGRGLVMEVSSGFEIVKLDENLQLFFSSFSSLEIFSKIKFIHPIRCLSKGNGNEERVYDDDEAECYLFPSGNVGLDEATSFPLSFFTPPFPSSPQPFPPSFLSTFLVLHGLISHIDSILSVPNLPSLPFPSLLQAFSHSSSFSSSSSKLPLSTISPLLPLLDPSFPHPPDFSSLPPPRSVGARERGEGCRSYEVAEWIGDALVKFFSSLIG